MGKRTYDVTATSHIGEDSVAQTKQANIILDTEMKGRVDAFNPAELLLAAVGACMLKSMQRVIPILDFKMRGARIKLHGIRQDVPPRIEKISYEIVLETNETDHRIALLHKNIRKYGTIYGTLSEATDLTGKIRRQT